MPWAPNTRARQQVVDPLLTPQDVAVRLGCSERTVYKLLREGAIRSHRIGTRWKVKPEDLRTYLESTVHAPVPQAQPSPRAQARTLPMDGTGPSF